MSKIKNIFVVSPSAPIQINDEQKKQAISKFNKLGFEVTFSKNCFENKGNTAGSIKNRVQDIEEGFSNSKYDLVMSMQGGFNSNEILPFLNYKLISQNPKPFCGMSDMTTLCLNLNQKSRIPTFYGLQFRHLMNSENNLDKTEFKQFLEVLNTPQSIQKEFEKDIKPENIFRKGEMKGKLVGGNLAVLCWLLGTPFTLQNFEDCILFLEDDEETNGYYLQMYLVHLKQAGIFDKIKGLIFGKVLANTEFQPNSNFNQILNTVFEDCEFPILTNANFGHIDLPITIPYNTFIKLNLN